ncbi:Hypothetical protein UVM_LOCUS402 [uncultured virus]|nr:Hypothetical protein UVM_LOCUS402 [uncultured virus]
MFGTALRERLNRVDDALQGHVNERLSCHVAPLLHAYVRVLASTVVSGVCAAGRAGSRTT